MLAEPVDQMQGRYPESVADYDRVHDAMFQMANMLSAGIIKQFPKKFRSPPWGRTAASSPCEFVPQPCGARISSR